MITHHQCEEIEPDRFISDASTVGLKPGVWPMLISTVMGNELPFQRQEAEKYKGEITSVHYSQLLGCIHLEIMND